jgi:hypothetical protein
MAKATDNAIPSTTLAAQAIDTITGSTDWLAGTGSCWPDEVGVTGNSLSGSQFSPANSRHFAQSEGPILFSIFRFRVLLSRISISPMPTTL